MEKGEEGWREGEEKEPLLLGKRKKELDFTESAGLPELLPQETVENHGQKWPVSWVGHMIAFIVFLKAL